MCEQFLQTAP